MGWPGAGRREQGEFVVNGVMGRIGSPPNSYMETPSTTEIGDEAFREVTKVKRGHKGGALITQDWYPLRRGGDAKLVPHPHVNTEKATRGFREKAAVY